MITIKFRGKDCETGEWLYGNLIQRIGRFAGIMFDYEHGGKIHYAERPVKQETVGQFTGLHDCNGIEIYEGDIVKFYYMTVEAYSSKLIPTKEMFGLITTNEYNQWIILSDGLEIHIENAVKYGTIVGNIHDNPELIKK